MDQTPALVQLFSSARATSPTPHASSRIPSRPDPFHEALQVLNKTVHRALERSNRCIEDAIQAMDACSASMSRVESKLLLCEAEMVAASSSIKEFSESIEGAIASLGARELKQRLASALSVLSSKNTGGNDGGLSHLSPQMLEHYKEVLQCLQARVGKGRFKLALCKEEVALYKSENVFFGRCGVLHCDPTGLPQKRKNVKDPLSDPNVGGGVAAISRKSPSKQVPSFGIVAHVSRQTMGLVDGVLQKATDRIKGASDTALTTLAMATTGGNLLSVTMSEGDSGGMHQGLPAPPRFNYTENEVEHLETQSLALQQVQRDATAQDAKVVEASVRDLSQLTSLMNEKVMEQSEQFSILVKNTEEARAHMNRAVQELVKPSNAFWNSTRQLIALIWICTCVVVVANWVLG